jgi:hypothetical protein
VQLRAPFPLADDRFRELVRLRGEVGMLRQQTNLLGKLREENRQLAAGMETSKDESVETAKFIAHSAAIVNAAKMIGVAFRVWANDNNDQFPTNFAQMHNELANTTNFNGDISLDSFEMLNVGKVNDTFPQAAAARERMPRPSPLGGWERVYLLADGSVQIAHSPDGNFDDWEQGNYVNSFPTPSQ